jgi:hypothetical protein
VTSVSALLSHKYVVNLFRVLITIRAYGPDSLDLSKNSISINRCLPSELAFHEPLPSILIALLPPLSFNSEHIRLSSTYGSGSQYEKG